MKRVRMAITLTFSVRESLEQLKADTSLEAMLAIMYHKVKTMAYEDFIKDTKIWHQMAGSFECEDEATPEVIEDMIEKTDRSLIFQMDVDKARVMLTHPNTLKAMLTTFAAVMGTDKSAFEVDPDAIEENTAEKKSH